MKKEEKWTDGKTKTMKINNECLQLQKATTNKWVLPQSYRYIFPIVTYYFFL